MLKLFSKNHLSAMLTFLLLSSSLIAEECCYPSTLAEECCYPSACNRLYIGAFGGGLWSNSTKMIQRGTIFFAEAQGGPLAVDARGNSGRNSSGFGGIQIGYEWSECPFNLGCSDWSVTLAAELEAYWYRHSKKGDLINPTNRLPEHDFVNSFPMNVGVYLFNGALMLNNCCLGKFTPYVGGGIGAAHISIHHAKSRQDSPPERGIDHFNSDRSDSSWAFAAQVKAGLRYNVCDRIHIFGEYRFLYVDSSNYIFGSTRYSTHATTSPWNVDIKHICYNGFAFGLQYDL